MSGDLKIAMCGLGLMGTPIAERIAAAGYQIAVWGRSAAKSGAVPHRAAYLARSASEAATNADVVVLCLANEQAVEEVVFGAEGVASQRRPRFVLDHSASPPTPQGDYLAACMKPRERYGLMHPCPAVLVVQSLEHFPS
jgi:3-hydroxyisobutyrate dehydrogenase-like beta-hydroxyacid dehydrogenase